MFAATSSETVLPRIITKLELLGCRRDVVGLVIPTGYSFNLDGTCLYLATTTVFLAQAADTPLDVRQQIGLLMVLLLTSKGAAAVAGAAFVVLAATLSTVGHVPVASVALVLGIHRLMSEGLTSTNLIGNAVATLAVARWKNALDDDQLQRQLAAAREPDRADQVGSTALERRRPLNSGSVPMTNRRDVLRASAAVPLTFLSLGREEAEAAPAIAPTPYTISINIEIMFNTGRGNPPMPRADRIRAVAAKGFKAYSYWNATPDERKAMIKAQEETGLKCVSLVGTGNAGGTTGFTKPGAQDALLAEIKERVDIAKEFGSQPDLITFVGIIQPDVPWETQRAQIVEGLKRAGDLAASAGVTIALEPLSVNPAQPRRALDRCLEAFPVIKEVNHPNVKVCFDLYHLQRTEGNLVVSLRNGLQDKLIKIVQIGDNPGRLEPGTGEINYPFIFKELRRLNWTGYVDTEHGTSSTADHAMEVVRKMAEEN